MFEGSSEYQNQEMCYDDDEEGSNWLEVAEDQFLKSLKFKSTFTLVELKEIRLRAKEMEINLSKNLEAVLKT